MTAPLESIRSAIVGVVQSVPDTGVVHPYERYAKSPADLAALYTQGGALAGWFVRRLRSRERLVGASWLRIDEWEIRGFRALVDADASEVAMDTVVEGICTAVRADDTLGGVVMDTGDLSQGDTRDAGVAVAESGPVVFCGVLCHGVSLRLTTTTVRHN